jgi:transposase
MVSGVEEIVRYTYRLRPGAQAERALIAEWHRCRWLWNEAVHQQRSGHKSTRAKLGKMLTAARARNTWLREGWQNAQANTLNTYAVALDRSFKVKGCGKPRVKKRYTASRMARKAADIALGATRRELVERAVRAGRQVVNVALAYTSMTCSSCFARTTQRLGLAERTFRCQDCGYTDTRDRNAAMTILALAERGQTSVDGVSHASASPSEVAVAVRPELQIHRL